MKSLLLSVALVLCMGPTFAWADDYGQYPIATKGGELQAIDIANRNVIINGVRYVVPIDVEVTINGSYGAFTMLTVGMYVNYEYQAIADDSRRLLSMHAFTSQAGREAA